MTSLWDTQVAVVRGLTEAGMEASLEYPGAVQVMLSPSLMLWTGLTGWDYGSMSSLTSAGWEPLDIRCEADLAEDETDPTTITKAWAAWVQHYLRSHS